MPNKWVEHIRAFAKKNNMTYGCALSDPRTKSSYKEGKDVPPLETPMRTARVIKATPPKPQPEPPAKAPEPAPAPAKAPAPKKKAEYIVGESGSNYVYMTANQLESSMILEVFIRMLRDNDAFKSKSQDTRLYNKMKKADAEEMADIIRQNQKKVNYFTREKFFKDFGRKGK